MSKVVLTRKDTILQLGKFAYRSTMTNESVASAQCGWPSFTRSASEYQLQYLLERDTIGPSETCRRLCMDVKCDVMR